MYRIETVLRQNNDDYDYDLTSLHEKYLSDIIEYEALMNWVNGKSYISEEVLPKIAKKLNVTLQWLLTKDKYHQQDFDAHLFGLAKAYSGLSSKEASKSLKRHVRPSMKFTFPSPQKSKNSTWAYY